MVEIEGGGDVGAGVVSAGAARGSAAAKPDAESGLVGVAAVERLEAVMMRSVDVGADCAVETNAHVDDIAAGVGDADAAVAGMADTDVDAAAVVDQGKSWIPLAQRYAVAVELTAQVDVSESETGAQVQLAQDPWGTSAEVEDMSLVI